MIRMSEKDAYKLDRLARTDSEIVDVLVNIFKQERNNARNALEDVETYDNMIRGQGRARAFRDVLGLFEDAARVVKAAEKKRREK